VIKVSGFRDIKVENVASLLDELREVISSYIINPDPPATIIFTSLNSDRTQQQVSLLDPEVPLLGAYLHGRNYSILYTGFAREL
jgi:hypothetical protein